MADKPCIQCVRKTHNAESIATELRLEARKLERNVDNPSRFLAAKTRVDILKSRLADNRDRLKQHQKENACTT